MLRYISRHEHEIPFDPTYLPPPEAAALRVLLRRMIHARDTGRDINGVPFGGTLDDLLDGINEAEAQLRPHRAGLLR